MLNLSKEPTFFIIGAPKCGTTSLSNWLSDHPNIFMCNPKEPYFFSTDIYSLRAAKTFEEYQQLFEKAEDSHLAIGEASTTYLRSKLAIPSILKRYPNASFIVCLRNPVEMVASVHMQLFRGGMESERSLQKAWELQDLRREGKHVPSLCPDPGLLQYGKVCYLGEQVESLLKEVSRQQVLFIFLEDLKNNPRQEYCRVQNFLGVPDDGRINFPVKNKRSQPRLPFLNRITSHANALKCRLGIKQSFGIGQFVNQINLVSVNKKNPE